MTPDDVLRNSTKFSLDDSIIYAQKAYDEKKRTMEEIRENGEITNELLEEQNKYLRQQLEVLRCIFSSEEKGLEYEREIWEILQDKVEAEHPLKRLLFDKGSDLIINNVPILFQVFKIFLESKGIML